MNNEINLIISGEELSSILKGKLGEIILSQMELHKEKIKEQIGRIFETKILADHKNLLSRAMDYALDDATRQALNEALVELGYKDIMKQEILSILSDPIFLRKIAVEKIRRNFGLPVDEE